MESLLNRLWVEKYRPKNMNDVVLEDNQKQFINRCLSNGEIPHLLFVGPAGSGKTTTARIICNEIIKHEYDLLLLNGSDQTGVDVVRDNIKGFLKSQAIESRHKIVFIDEFDYMTQNAQASLRNIFETYAETGRFICTGNYKSKIIEPLHSRFQIFEMKTISEKFALEYCTNILDKENVQYNIDNVELVVQSLLPDVRRIINTLQKSIVDGQLRGINKDAITSIEKKLIALICLICDNIGTNNASKAVDTYIQNIHSLFSEGQPDFLAMYTDLFNNEKIPAWGKIAVNKYANMHYSSALPQMHFIAMIWEMIQNGMNFYKTFGGK